MFANNHKTHISYRGGSRIYKTGEGDPIRCEVRRHRREDWDAKGIEKRGVKGS